MVGSQREQDAVDEQNVLEVVDDALAIQKVHCGAQKVPVERLCEAQTAGLTGDVCDGNDLLEGHNLDCGDDDDDVEMAGAEGPEEAGNHEQGPYCARDEVCLFLFILGLLDDCCGLEGEVVSGGVERRVGVGVGRSAGRGAPRTGGSRVVLLRNGLLGASPWSLYSERLVESRLARPLEALPTRCWNLTSLRERAMVVRGRAEVRDAGGEIGAAWQEGRGRATGATQQSTSVEERLGSSRRAHRTDGRGGCGCVAVCGRLA